MTERDRQARQDARDRRASLEATRAQITRAYGRSGTREPNRKPEEEWSTTERQLYAARGIEPVAHDDDY